MRLPPPRSGLFMPGSNPRAIEKARSLDADALILDLEDAVGPEQKQEARTLVREALRQGGFGQRELIVRVNGLETEWAEDDLRMVAVEQLDGVLIPKVESAEDLTRARQILTAAGAPSSLPLWAMAETPRGILNLVLICAGSAGLQVLVAGTSDLARDLRVRHTADRVGLIGALSQCVLAARANGLDVLDGVYLDLHNAEGFRHACQQGRDLGFDGKTCIHPSQLQVTNEVFSPTAVELELARRVIAAWDEAQAQGKGLAVVNGRLVESLHVEEARRTLLLQETIEARRAG
ncbi:MAG: CoA ester lyase [Ectothiorhodospiraceae bacterium]|nr:CoA ester lyase [Ectothiorhodospiraceae bacterium]